MDTDIVQRLRYKLQRRVRRVNGSTSSEQFGTYLRQFHEYINGTPLTLGVLEDLRRRHPEAESVVDELYKGERDELDLSSETRHAAIADQILKRITNTEVIYSVISKAVTMVFQPRSLSVQETREYLFDHVVEFLYDYIDEHLDDQRALLALLRRYKHRCEWFDRERLHTNWEEDTRRGERNLAYDLYQYLHDQGINFSIEPESASGRADLVKAQTGEEPLIADVKLFHSGKGKGRSYLRKGFSQIYEYTQEYNQPIGYLVIFNICEDRLDLALSGVTQTTPYIEYNNKTLFFMEVDIYPYETSASERGEVKSHDLTEEYLLY